MSTFIERYKNRTPGEIAAEKIQADIDAKRDVFLDKFQNKLTIWIFSILFFTSRGKACQIMTKYLDKIYYRWIK